MKRFSSVMAALLVVLGSVGIAAAFTVDFNVDFWATGNPTPEHNYAKGGADLGGTFDLLPGEKINVEIYFTTVAAITSGSWKLNYTPSNLASVQGTTPAGYSPWALPLFDPPAAGVVGYQDAVSPGSNVSGTNKFFGSVLFQCEGVGPVNLVLSNYLGFFTLTEQFNFTDVQLGTLNQVPIPGAVWLLGSGLLGLVGLSRKWRK